MSRYDKKPVCPGLDVLERVETPLAYKGVDSTWRVRCRFCGRVYIGQRSAIRVSHGCIACLHERKALGLFKRPVNKVTRAGHVGLVDGAPGVAGQKQDGGEHGGPP
jgi:hypothetical protein